MLNATKGELGSAYTLLTVGLRQVNVKGATKGELSLAYTLLTVGRKQVNVKV